MSIRSGRGTILTPSPSLFTMGSVFLLNRDHYGWDNIRGVTNGFDNFTATDRRTRSTSADRQTRYHFQPEEAVNSNAVPSKTVSWTLSPTVYVSSQ